MGRLAMLPGGQNTISAPLSPSGRAGSPTGAAAGSSPDLAASLSHRGLVAASAHAELCSAVEECAPPVTATYLQAAYDRMRLPISVSISCNRHFWVRRRVGETPRCWHRTPADATRAYLDLCRTLSTPASPGNSAAGAVR